MRFAALGARGGCIVCAVIGGFKPLGAEAGFGRRRRLVRLIVVRGMRGGSITDCEVPVTDGPETIVVEAVCQYVVEYGSMGEYGFSAAGSVNPSPLVTSSLT